MLVVCWGLAIWGRRGFYAADRDADSVNDFDRAGRRDVHAKAGRGRRQASTLVAITTALFFAVAVVWTAVTGLWLASVTAGGVGVMAVALMIQSRRSR